MMKERQMEQTQSERKLLGAQTEDDLMSYILGTPVPIGEKLPNEFELGQLFSYRNGCPQDVGHQVVFRLGAQKLPLRLCLFHLPLLHGQFGDSVIPHTGTESNAAVPLAR